MILSTERRQARTIQNLPEALRRQVAATPEHFHDLILQAYNKSSRRPLDLRHRHVRYNPPSGSNVGENLLWLLECAAAGTPIFEVGPSWISQGGRGVFRTKYCVRLPKNFRIPLHGHFPSAPATTEEEADAIFMGQPILRFWGGPDNAFICSRDSGGPAVLGHLMNTPLPAQLLLCKQPSLAPGKSPRVLYRSTWLRVWHSSRNARRLRQLV